LTNSRHRHYEQRSEPTWTSFQRHIAWPVGPDCVPVIRKALESDSREKLPKVTSGCDGRCVKQLGQHPAPKNTYLAAQYRRLMVRRGKKRTIVAVAHSMLIIADHLLQRGCTYGDLGADYFHRKQSGRLKNRLLKRLTGLGYQVTLTPTFSSPTTETA